MIRIAQVVESFAYGSAKSVKQLCGTLKQDYKVAVYYGVRDGTDLELRDLDPDIEWIPLPGRGRRKHVTNIRFLHRTLSPATRVLHGHSTYGGLYARLVGLARRDLAVLYSPRGFAFLREDCRRWQRTLFWLAERMIGPAGTTVSCGPAEYQVARGLGNRVVNINNGHRLPANPPVEQIGHGVLAIGRICAQKGFDRFKAVAAAMPSIDFCWIGSAEPSDSALCAALPSNITLVPCERHSRVMERIAECRFIFHPSRWEGLSRVLLESVALGKAIVTSDFPSNVDCLTPLCEDGASPPLGEQYEFANGFACKTVDQYINAIHRLSVDNSLLLQMQQQSLQHARRHFDLDCINQLWRSLYRQCCDGQAVGCEVLPNRRSALAQQGRSVKQLEPHR